MNYDCIDPTLSQVLPAMCGKVKGHTEALLSGFDVGLVELVTLFDRWESGILKDKIKILLQTHSISKISEAANTN